MIVLAALLAAAGADVRALVAELDRLAERAGWPGFDARAVPLVIHDGAATWLVRHPSPPPEFAATAGSEEGAPLRYEGRHDAVRANTSTEIGGVLAASLMLGEEAEREWAGVLLHECFHVFQRERHPGWRTNEALLLTYPFGDAEMLALRRLESAALREALETADAADSEAARRACALRARRAGRDGDALAYERGVELVEGLAQYVERRALGMAGVELPAVEPPAPAAMVRRRAYHAGEAWARLLDRFAPGWKERFESGEADVLDLELARALGGTGEAPGVPAEALAAARRDVEASAAVREERRAELEGAPGHRLEIRAGEEAALRAEGFDPLNVDVITGGIVIHERYVSLGGGGSSVEVLGRACLTRSAGAHPLFAGIAELVVPGLPEPPAVERDGEATVVRADGVTARLAGCEVQREGATTRITLR